MYAKNSAIPCNDIIACFIWFYGFYLFGRPELVSLSFQGVTFVTTCDK